MLKHVSADQVRAFIQFAEAVLDARDEFLDRSHGGDLDAESHRSGRPQAEATPLDDVATLGSTVYAHRFDAMRRAIGRLQPEARHELRALIAIGRGDFSATQWDDALADAEARDDSDGDPVIETASLSAYLAMGLHQMSGPAAGGGEARLIASFHEWYLAELQELRDGESQLLQGIRRMAESAGHPELKNALMDHHDHKRAQLARLDTLLASHRADAQAHHDQAMRSLLQESDKIMAMLPDTDLRDAGIIASAQKLEHYQIAAYGTGAALAGQLELRDDQKLLHEALEQERKADALLSIVAKKVVNPDAAGRH
jgi:ferritin-like metal-binding protein YciE